MKIGIDMTSSKWAAAKSNNQRRKQPLFVSISIVVYMNISRLQQHGGIWHGRVAKNKRHMA